MTIAFVGDLSIDINTVRGVTHTAYGGGALAGGMTTHHLGVPTTVYTKCDPEQRPRFAEIGRSGLPVVFLPGGGCTSIENNYPTDDPDDRTSLFLSRSDPFDAGDVARMEADVLHVNPLWMGQFPPELFALARERAPLLAADAQGFLRHVHADGTSSFHGWPEAGEFLPHLDLLKVDANEARHLTGLDEHEPAARALHEMGASVILLTHARGLLVFDGQQVCTAEFAPYSIEGRTGRGDTCTAAFFVGRQTRDLQGATDFAAEITSAKMQYPGPYRG